MVHFLAPSELVSPSSLPTGGTVPISGWDKPAGHQKPTFDPRCSFPFSTAIAAGAPCSAGGACCVSAPIPPTSQHSQSAISSAISGPMAAALCSVGAAVWGWDPRDGLFPPSPPFQRRLRELWGPPQVTPCALQSLLSPFLPPRAPFRALCSPHFPTARSHSPSFKRFTNYPNEVRRDQTLL